MKPVSNKKWFDKDCRFKRHEVRKLSNQKHRDPLNENLREKYHVALADYKKLLSRKQTDRVLQLKDYRIRKKCRKFG